MARHSEHSTDSKPTRPSDKRSRYGHTIIVALIFLIILPYLMGADAADSQPANQEPAEGSPGIQSISAAAGERGRVKIKNGTVVADNNYLLRGEHLIFSDNSAPNTPDDWLDRMYDITFWQTLKNDFHMNTVRLMIMRPPQNWGGGPGENCFYPVYRCYHLDYKLSNGKTVLQVMDDVVDIAAGMGMYIIIDYHPVGGYNRSDAIDWWNTVAPRYKSRTHVLYELANEPVAWYASSYNEAAVDFQEDLYQLIRGHAPNTHIILWSFANATGPMLAKVQEGTRINYANASVGYHPYNYDESTVLALKAQYPVFNSEIGENRLQRIQEAEKIGVSWITLGGAKTHGVSPGGFSPAEVFWPKDPGTGGSAPTPTPTSTPKPTKEPTSTTEPTSTPKATKEATNTPDPTNTPDIPPTGTVDPSSTPRATRTPKSTGTPESSATPEDTPIPVEYDHFVYMSFIANRGQ